MVTAGTVASGWFRRGRRGGAQGGGWTNDGWQVNKWTACALKLYHQIEDGCVYEC